MKCLAYLPVLIAVSISAVAARSPYYDAIVVEGRDDSEDSENSAFEADDCLLPAMAGPCRAGIPMYYYSPDTGRCSKFRWGGCGGNSNRFHSRSECETRCGGVEGTNVRPARPTNGVTCVRDPATLTCGQGCFSRRDQEGCYECSCSKPTQKPKPEVCDLPPARGHCRALLPRWTYDVSTRRCQEFRFGGCDGNGNNFMSEAECLEICGGYKRTKPSYQAQSAQDRYDYEDTEQQASNYYSTTNYSSAAASLLKYVFERFWPGGK